MKRLLSIALCFLLTAILLAGCAEKSAPAQTDVSSQTSSSSEVVSSSSEQEIPVVPYTPEYLTGCEQGADYNPNRRITAVMVNNIVDCRPQRGISDADVVYEIVTEGGITRLCCLFSDYEKMPTVGPVRSARDQFFQLIYSSQPLYAHVGASTVCQNMMALYDYSDYDLNGYNIGSLIWRDQARINAGYATEHTAYTDAEHIAASVQSAGLDARYTYTSPLFNFVNYNDPVRVPAGEDALDIHVVYTPHSWYYSDFTYDAARGQYLKSQSGEAHIDENNGQQLAFDNVVICFTNITLYDNSPLSKVDYGNDGVAYYFSQGKVEKVFWTKGGVENPLRLEYVQGDDSIENQVPFNCGKTYIGFTDYKNFDAFTYSGPVDNVEIDPSGAATSEVEVEGG